MVAEGYDDCETDIIDRVRQIVGPDAKIGVELDLHCDVTQAMIDTADAIVLYKEYPHTDVVNRAADLFNIIADAAEGKTDPTMALFDCRMIGLYLTSYEPLRSFVDEILAMEGKDGILSISLVHCFPWADVPTCGAQALAITDGDADKAAQVAKEIGRRFHGMRRELDQTPLSIEEALTQGTSRSRRSGRHRRPGRQRRRRRGQRLDIHAQGDAGSRHRKRRHCHDVGPNRSTGRHVRRRRR